MLPAVEVTAVVYNINKGHNSRLMCACQTLADYAYFMSLIRSYNVHMPLAEAIDAAMQQCIDEGVLADYLSSKRAEVKSMLITEFDQAEYEQIVEREKREIAEAARAEGRRDIVAALVGSGKLTREEAAELLGADVADLNIESRGQE